MTTLMAMEHRTPAEVANYDRRWWILGVLGIAQFMVILDSTIVNIALPTAQRDLHFSNADRQWIVTAYSLAFGSLLLLGGRIGDMVGRKRALITGLVGFAVANGQLPTEGAVVLDQRGRAAGQVTSARRSRQLERVIGMAWVPSALASDGQAITIADNGVRLSASVVTEPFHDPAGELLRS